MYWSVHQYQMPTIGDPIRMPSQGKSGSLSGRHRANWVASSEAIARNSPQPPNCCRPKYVMQADPISSTNTCAVSVYSTARMPPKAV